MLGFYFVIFLLICAVLCLYVKRVVDRKFAQIYALPGHSGRRATIDLSLRPTIRILIKFLQGARSSKELFSVLDHDLSALYFLLGPFSLIVVHPEDLKTTLSSPDWDKERQMAMSRWGHFSDILGESLIANGEEPGWRHRKALNPAFTFAKIKSMLPIFVSVTSRMLDIWEKNYDPKKTINMVEIFSNFTFDIIGLTSFGYDFQAMTNPSNEAKHNLDVCFEGIRRPWDMLFRGNLHKLPLPYSKKLKAASYASKKLIMKLLDKRMEDRKNAKVITNVDLLDMILDFATSEEGKEFALSRKQIVHDMILFLIAGHDTSSSALTGAMYFLGRYPQFQEAAFEEVTRVLGDGREINSENFPKFKLIPAIFKETLRLHPAVSSVGRREAMRDTKLGGLFIPKGTKIITDVCRAHWSDEFWKDPKKFDPYRFMIQEETELSDITMPKSFFAFSAGPRMCIGHKFSITEMTVALAMIVQRYRWRLTPDFKWEDDPAFINTVPKGGLPVYLEKRV